MQVGVTMESNMRRVGVINEENDGNDLFLSLHVTSPSFANRGLFPYSAEPTHLTSHVGLYCPP